MVYTPEYSINALKYFYHELGDKLWGECGFCDAFNPQLNWFATSYLAIDEGTIIAMIENYRTGLIWKNFMLNPEIKTALDAIGFVPDSTTTQTEIQPNGKILSVIPNPLQANGTIVFSVPSPQNISIGLYNQNGQKIKTILNDSCVEAGQQTLNISASSLPGGIYLIQLVGKNLNAYQKISISH
jgi:hypothetical protein